MVRLTEISTVNKDKYPFLSEWDLKMRKSFAMYQKLIDAKTYQLQRIQRYLLALPYPAKYHSELITLDLLKKKQRVGEVTAKEVELYESIDPNVKSNFNTTFSFNFSKVALGTSLGLFAYSSLFNFSIATRFMYFTLPLVCGYVWSMRTSKEEVKTSEFLDWVFEYRKARVFNEKYRDLFNNKDIKSVIGTGNLVELGDQLIRLTH